jgi:hypothetical protein
MALHNLPEWFQSQQADFPASGRALFVNGIGYMLAWGTTVPADATTGYGTGCLFFHTDAATVADALYINGGSTTSANFDQQSASIGSGYTSNITANTSNLTVVSDSLSDLRSDMTVVSDSLSDTESEQKVVSDALSDAISDIVTAVSSSSAMRSPMSSVIRSAPSCSSVMHFQTLRAIWSRRPVTASATFCF